jgi:ketoreductase
MKEPPGIIENWRDCSYLSCILEESFSLMLDTKVALVTGGGTGIGKAIAAALSKNGAKVAVASRSSTHIEQAAKELSGHGRTVIAVPMDVRKKADVQRAVAEVVARWGAIHILVNNAGISGLSLINNEDDSKWYDVVETNLNGLYLVTKEVLKFMPNQLGGRIINVSSVLGKFGVPGYTAYCTTKHGIIGFTRSLALEVVQRGITVNTICPGWVDTEMASLGINETAVLQGITPEQFKAQAIAAVPIRRFLDANEIAELVSYIASDAAKGITGQAINICGGQTMV